MDPTSTPIVERSDPANDQRLADLEVFVRGVVHDLNNALNVMKTNLYLLRQRLPGDETKIVRPLTRIEDQVGAIRVLLEGYQSFYHAEQPAFQRANLNEVARNVLAATMIPEGYQVQLELDDTLPVVEADPKLIEAALRALIRNSIRAMSGTGTIRITSREEAGAVEFAVEDSGPGIPAEIRDRALEPFVSTWPEHAGLGLALVDR
ncbi:MAG: histidine kinase, partial [Armatimonadetes bacterium]|nr:histidine kinase [Armatimonadota bacterium]